MLFGFAILASLLFITNFISEPLTPVSDSPATTQSNTRIIELFDYAPRYTAFNPQSCQVLDGSPYQKLILLKHPSILKITNSFEKNGLELIEEAHTWVASNIAYKEFADFRSLDIILFSNTADCTGMSNLLSTFLENLGFESYVAYTKTHAFVVVKYGEIWYSIDATSQDIWGMYNWKKSTYIHYLDVLGIYNSKGAARC